MAKLTEKRLLHEVLSHNGGSTGTTPGAGSVDRDLMNNLTLLAAGYAAGRPSLGVCSPDGAADFALQTYRRLLEKSMEPAEELT